MENGTGSSAALTPELEKWSARQEHCDRAGVVARRLAHDYGNLLTSILGYCELALTAIPADHPAHQYLTKALQSAQRGARLTEQVHIFSHRVDDKAEDLCCVTKVMEEEAKRLEEEHGPSVRVELGTFSLKMRIPLSERLLAQALQALTMNALEAMGGEGCVTLEAEELDAGAPLPDLLGSPRPGRYVRIAVTDTGPGLSAEAREGLFTMPFYSDKPRQRGYGLALVHGVVKAGRGGMRLCSEPDQGTRAEMYFPLVSSLTTEASPTP